MIEQNKTAEKLDS